METHSEIDRLQRVYREYSSRGFGRTKWSPANKGNRAAQDELHFQLGKLLERTGFFPLGGRRILDVGCGTGDRLAAFVNWGAQPGKLTGVDLISDRVCEARTKHPEIAFKVANAEALPFADGSFDLVAAFTVFTSILDRRMAANAGHEMIRVLHSGGAVIWYDFKLNNPRNRHVRGISRKQIQEIFPGFKADIKSITLLPPLARRLGRLTNWLYPALGSLPFLRSHHLGVLVKP